MISVPVEDILDEVTSTKKRQLVQRTVVDPAELVNAAGDDSWTQDDRENLPVSPRVVVSLIRAHSTNNLTDGDTGSSFVNNDGKKVVGNPIIFGSLGTKNVTIMGTDEKPLLVMSAAGRQTSKASEWLSAFLLECRRVLASVNGDVTRAQGTIMARDSDAVTTEVVNAFSEADWLVIFKAGSRIGKPLVTVDYSARCWIKVGYGNNKPFMRRSLEDAKRDNIRVPSTFSGEARTLRRLVRSYVLDDGFSEEGALRHARSLVANPVAVGANSDPTDDYVQRLYRFAFLCDAVRAEVDTETDPIRALTKLAKHTTRYFKAAKESEERDDGSKAVFTVNKLSEEEQLALMAPKPKAEPKPKTAAPEPKAAPSPSSATPTRTDSRFVPYARYNEAARRLTAVAAAAAPADSDREDASVYYEKKIRARELEAIADFLRYQTMGAKALRDKPWLAEAVAQLEEDDDHIIELSKMLEAWNGRTVFALREPNCDEDGNIDRDDQALLRRVAPLLKELNAALSKQKFDKPEDRAAWATTWLVKKASGSVQA